MKAISLNITNEIVCQKFLAIAIVHAEPVHRHGNARKLLLHRT